VIAPGSTIEKIDLPPPAWKTNDRSAATLPAVATTVAVAARTPLVLRRLPGDPSTQPVEPVTQPIVGTPRMIQFIHHPQRSKWRVKVGAVAWNPLDGAEGRALAAVQDDRDTYLYSWDVVTGEQAGRVRLGGEGVSPMPRAISRDATRVFCFSHGADGMGADVWDAATGARIARHTGPVDSLGALALSRNGFVVAVGGATYEQKGAWAVMSADIGVWDARSGGDITKLPGDGREVSAIAFSPDGTRLVSGSDEPDVPDHIAAPAPAQRKIPGVRLWDIKTARETAHFVGPLNVRGLAFTSDGKRIVLCGDGQGGWDNIWVLDGQTLAPIASTKVVHSQLTALAISPDGTRLLTGGSDSNVRIWELATLREIHRFEEHAARITCVAFSPHGRRAVSGDEAGGLGIWELPAPADR